MPDLISLSTFLAKMDSLIFGVLGLATIGYFSLRNRNAEKNDSLFSQSSALSDPLKALQEFAKLQNFPMNSKSFANKCDKQNGSLLNFRNHFLFPSRKNDSNKSCIYLCGNSLGLQPKATKSMINIELDKWEKMAVAAHHKDSKPVGLGHWMTVDERLKKASADLVGAKEDEVAIMGSLSNNLHLLMVAFYTPTKTKYKIIIEAKSFPSDYFIVESQLKFHGFDPKDAIIEIQPRPNEKTLRDEDIIKLINENGSSTALVLISGVQFYSGQFFDIANIAKTAKSNGCNIGVDLAHAVGNVKLELHDWGVDFAAWCTYKYLNGGPGNIAGIYVHENHDKENLNRFNGWWGHRKEDRFVMHHNFVPSKGAASFMLSNPPVICCAALKASLDIFENASFAAVQLKSRILTCYLEALLLSTFKGEITIITPKEVNRRGTQLSIEFSDAYSVRGVEDELFNLGVIVDVREPNAMRLAPAPLYVSFADVHEFVEILAHTLKK